MDSDNCMTDCGYQLVEDLSYRGNPVYTKPADNSSMSMGEALVKESSPMGPPPPTERTDVITDASPMSTEPSPMSTEPSPMSTEPMSTEPMSTEPMSTEPSPMSTEPMSTEPSPMLTEPMGPPPMERTDVITEASPESSSLSREMGGRKSRRVRGKKSRKSRKSRKSKTRTRR